MLDLALRTACILAFAWVVSRLLRRATAATRHLVWHTAIVAVVLAPFVTPLTPRLELAVLPASATAIGTSALPIPNAEAPASSESTISPNATSLSRVTVPGNAAPSVATLVWLTGSTLVATWIVLGWIATAWSTRRSRPARPAWQLEVNALCARLGINREVMLRTSDREMSPVTAGIWRSVILLPTSAASWSAPQRQAVLLHELAHIRRHDCRVQATAQVACAFYWFNPLVWVAAAALRREREHACDDEVLRHGAQPSAYAAHLLEIARHLHNTLRPSAALAMARPSQLEGRLLAVLAEGRARVPARGTRCAVASALTVAAATILSASPTPRAAAQEPVLPARQAPRVYAPIAETMHDSRTEPLALVDRAAQALASDDAGARERAALDLMASGQDDAIAPLVTALRDPSQDVREKAALGLGLMSNPDVIEPLLLALRDPDAQVREKAAIGLALRRDGRVVDALLEAMRDPDAQVREKVALALGTSGDPRALAPLQEALHDSDPQVREKAVTGLTLLHQGPPSTERGTQVRDGLRGLVRLLTGIAPR